MKTLKTLIAALLISVSAFAQNVGINADGTAPDGSAMLDVSSTTKGLLIPNIALSGTTDAATITTPALSLLVYNTATVSDVTPGYYYNSGTPGSPVWTRINVKPDWNAASGNVAEILNKPTIPTAADGSETKVTAGTNVTVTGAGTTGSPYVINATGSGTHYLGEAFDGGIIYYLYKGSDGLEHGLIVALTESTATWQTTATLVNANRTEDGAYNTALMTGSPAATYVATLGAGWYLPSIDELGLLYYNRYSAQKGLRTGGNTLLSYKTHYWSSTEYDAALAFTFVFNLALPHNYNKTNSTYSVRAVRAF
ncbi:MAG: hypothetical protein WCM93_16920 [Bacteroidota bacterium]